VPAELDRALREAPDAGETTLVVVSVGADRLVGASVGDSGALLLAEGRTRELTAAQRAKPFLGTGAARPVPFEHPRREGRLLLATDGLLKYAAPDEIREAALSEDLPASADGLLDLVRLPSGELMDDVALVLCPL
jgi:serine/threonine protein phosphatase PrpC